MNRIADTVQYLRSRWNAGAQRLTDVHGVDPERLGVILLFAALSCWVLWLWRATGMASREPLIATDDAYITLQNALVLSGLRADHFVGAAPLSGVTSLYHTLLVSLLARFLPPEVSLSVAGLLGALVYAAGLIAVARRAGLGMFAAGALAYLGLASGYMPHLLNNGLETSWALAAVSWTLYLLMSIPRHGTWLAGMLVLLSFVRPELAILSILAVGYWLLAIRHDREALQNALIRLAVFGVAGAGLVLALGWGPVPNTVFAKRYFYASWCNPFREKLFMLHALTDRCLLPYGVLLLGLAGWLRERLGLLLGAYTALFVMIYWTSHIGALGYYEGRYMAPLVPMLALGLARLLLPLSPSPRHLWIVLLGLACLYPLLYSTPSVIALSAKRRADTNNELMALAEWVKHNIPSQARIMTHDIGYLGYAVQQPLVDLVGLKSDTAMRLHRQLSWPTCGGGRPAAITALTAQERPAYLIVLKSWDRALKITESVSTVAGIKLLRDSDRGYSVYSLHYPDLPRD
jgi:hypothetical protein